jgi:signal transduction histidine kinase
LLRSDTKWDQATQHEFLTIIDEEADRLMYLLDHLLDSARLQSGVLVMDFQPVRLDSLIRDVAMRIRSRHKSIEIELDLQPAPPIRADTVRLVQVFDNLFENSLKYAPNSKIVISMKKLDEYIRVTFSDHGPGILPEHLPFLFERFYRVPNQEGKRGTGLGLYICREIIRAHSGLISIETSPDKGTTFIIELPYHQN